MEPTFPPLPVAVRWLHGVMVPVSVYFPAYLEQLTVQANCAKQKHKSREYVPAPGCVVLAASSRGQEYTMPDLVSLDPLTPGLLSAPRAFNRYLELVLARHLLQYICLMQ